MWFGSNGGMTASSIVRTFWVVRVGSSTPVKKAFAGFDGDGDGDCTALYIYINIRK